jgi:hypothetical protein
MRIPVFAPFCRRQKLFTGGLKPLRGVAKINSLIADLERPVHAQSWPLGGSLKNSGGCVCAAFGGGTSSCSVVVPPNFDFGRACIITHDIYNAPRRNSKNPRWAEKGKIVRLTQTPQAGLSLREKAF